MEKERARDKRQRANESRERKGHVGREKKHSFLFSSGLISCWNENLYNLEACCFNMSLHASTHTHTHTLTFKHSASGKKTWGSPAVYWVIVDSSSDEICFNLWSAGGTVGRKPQCGTEKGGRRDRGRGL